MYSYYYILLFCMYSYYMGQIPCLLVTDPEVAKQITVKQFDSFTNRLVSIISKYLTINHN